MHNLYIHWAASLPLWEVIIIVSQGNGWKDKMDISSWGLMNQPSQPEAGKITSCIFHIFFFKLTIKKGILYKQRFLTACESACNNSDNSFSFNPMNKREWDMIFICRSKAKGAKFCSFLLVHLCIWENTSLDLGVRWGILQRWCQHAGGVRQLARLCLLGFSPVMRVRWLVVNVVGPEVTFSSDLQHLWLWFNSMKLQEDKTRREHTLTFSILWDKSSPDMKRWMSNEVGLEHGGGRGALRDSHLGGCSGGSFLFLQ